MLREYAIVIFLTEEDVSGGEAVSDEFSCELKDSQVVFPVFFIVVPRHCLCICSCC